MNTFIVSHPRPHRKLLRMTNSYLARAPFFVRV